MKRKKVRYRIVDEKTGKNLRFFGAENDNEAQRTFVNFLKTIFPGTIVRLFVFKKRVHSWKFIKRGGRDAPKDARRLF